MRNAEAALDDLCFTYGIEVHKRTADGARADDLMNRSYCVHRIIVLGHYDSFEAYLVSYAHEVGHLRDPVSGVDRVECECRAWLWAIDWLKFRGLKFERETVDWCVAQLRTYESHYRNAGGDSVAYLDRAIPEAVIQRFEEIARDSEASTAPVQPA